MRRKSDTLGFILFLLILWCSLNVCTSAPSNNLKCNYKTYSHRAEQIDFNGFRCWGDVKIRSCGGYCRSHEVSSLPSKSAGLRSRKETFIFHKHPKDGKAVTISHWEFPYKKSFHPVCVHGARKHASVKLNNCDPGVEPGTEMYHYLEAINCKCQVCSSEDTSCEWLPPDSSLIKGFLSDNSEMSNEIDDYPMD